MLPRLHRSQPRPPSAESVAAADLKEKISTFGSRWELQALLRGSSDATAALQAAKSLQALVQQLLQLKNICRRAEVRQQLSKHLPPSLLLALLRSSSVEATGLTLLSLQELARLVPGLVRIDVAAQLLQLLGSDTHGASITRLLFELLSQWRFSQLWPLWQAAGTTDSVFTQLSNLVTAASSTQARGRSSSKNVHKASSNTVETCVNHLALLARLLELSEQHVMQQLAGSTDMARSWLVLLLRLYHHLAPATAGSITHSRLLDACCQLLHGFSNVSITTEMLLRSPDLRLQLLSLLHKVLCRPCIPFESDEGHIQCWTHAARTASLPVLWFSTAMDTLQAGNVAGSHASSSTSSHTSSSNNSGSDRLATDLVVSAAQTLSSGNSQCSSSSAGEKLTQQLQAACIELLVAAVLPPSTAFGSRHCSVGRMMPMLLSCECSHSLMHALAVAAEVHALNITSSSNDGSGRDRAQQLLAETMGQVCLVASASAAQQPYLAWVLLRMVCAQCVELTRTQNALPHHSSSAVLQDDVSSTGSISKASGGMLQPSHIMRVLQAYSGFGPKTFSVSGELLRSLQLLLCQAAVPEYKNVDDNNSSSNNIVSGSSILSHTMLGRSDVDVNLGKLSPVALHTVLIERLGPLLMHYIAGLNQTHTSGVQNCARLPQELLVCAHASLSVALAVQRHYGIGASVRTSGAAPTASATSATSCVISSSASMSCEDLRIMLSATQLSATALKVLLPALLAAVRGSYSAAWMHHAQQQQVGYQLEAGSRAGSRASSNSGHSSRDGSRDSSRDSSPSIRSGRSSKGHGSTSSKGAQNAAPVVFVEGLLECCLAALQALLLLGQQLMQLMPKVSSALLQIPAGTAEAATKAAAARSAATALLSALDATLQQLLAAVVICQPTDIGIDSLWNGRMQHAGMYCSVQATVLHQLQQDIRCSATAVMAVWYGHLGTRSQQGELLGLARRPDAHFCDAQLLLPDKQSSSQQLQQPQQPNQSAGQQQQIHDIPVHAAIVAVGCSVLGRQLLAASLVRGTADSQQQLQSGALSAQEQQHSTASHKLHAVKLSTAVEHTALQHCLDYIYTGAAVIPEAGLVAQLWHCLPGKGCVGANDSSSSSSVGARILPHHSGASSMHQQQQAEWQMQQLLGQREAAQSQLAELGRLSKKLQLPLLAAACASILQHHRPLVGQHLQPLHPQLEQLLPEQLFVLPADDHHQRWRQQRQQKLPSSQVQPGSGQQCDMSPDDDTSYSIKHSKISSISSCTTGAQMEHTAAPGSNRTSDDDDGSSSSDSNNSDSNSSSIVIHRHRSSLQYLDMLSLNSCAPEYVLIQWQQQQHQCSNTAPAVSCPFADVLLAAPAMVCPAQQDLQRLQQQPHEYHQQQRQQQVGQEGWQKQQQQEQSECYRMSQPSPGVAMALLPAHQVLLSCRCQYFEALLSQRWQQQPQQENQHSSQQQQQHTGVEVQQQQLKQQQLAAYSQSGTQQGGQQQRMRHPRVVVVPEADVHVAAALQHYLYTGTLQLKSPEHQVMSQMQPMQKVPLQQQQQQQHCELQLAGCTLGCHSARTLLRLWRCAGLLLLPDLQEACLAALQAIVATQQQQLLSCQCFLQLLDDCCTLGVPAVLQPVILSLVDLYDKADATAAPEWHQLPAVLQDHLTESWRIKQQKQGSDILLSSVGGTGAGCTAAVTPAVGLGTGHRGAAAAAALIGDYATDCADSGSHMAGMDAVCTLPASYVRDVGGALADFGMHLQQRQL